MKKWLFCALPLVAGASWAGTTLYSGAQSEDAYKQLVQQLDQMSVLSVTQEHWQPGFLESEAITRVSMSDAADAPVLFRLKHQIHHSPVNLEGSRELLNASRIVTTLATDASSDGGEQLVALFDGTPLTLTTHIGFGGSSTNTLDVAAMQIESPELTLAFAPSQYDFSLDPEGHLKGAGSIGSLSVNVPDAFDLAMDAGTDEFDLDWAREGIYTGSQNVKLGKIRMNNAMTGMETVFESTSLKSTSSVKDDRLSSGLVIDSRIIDPMIPVEQILFSTEVENLDMNGITRYMSVTQKLIGGQSAGKDPMAGMSELVDAYKAIFAPGSGLRYGLELSNAEGVVKAHTAMEFNGDGSASGSDNMNTVGDLLAAMKGELEVDADLTALAMTPLPMLLQDPSMAQWIVNDGEKITTRITVKDMVVDINGNPLPLEMMLGDMLQMPLDMSQLTE